QAKARDRAADERPSRQPFVGGPEQDARTARDNGCDLGYSSADARILANTIERRVGEPCQGDRRLRRGRQQHRLVRNFKGPTRKFPSKQQASCWPCKNCQPGMLRVPTPSTIRATFAERFIRSRDERN